MTKGLLKYEKMKIEITKTQAAAIRDAYETINAMRGCGEPEAEKQFDWLVKHLRNLLIKNNLL